jgi:hypothetical protein
MPPIPPNYPTNTIVKANPIILMLHSKRFYDLRFVLSPLRPAHRHIETETALHKSSKNTAALQDLVVDKSLLVPGESIEFLPRGWRQEVEFGSHGEGRYVRFSFSPETSEFACVPRRDIKQLQLVGQRVRDISVCLGGEVCVWSGVPACALSVCFGA